MDISEQNRTGSGICVSQVTWCEFLILLWVELAPGFSPGLNNYCLRAKQLMALAPQSQYTAQVGPSTAILQVSFWECDPETQP